ncbi:MAG: PSD1 domain-containing protein [Verrucomicrobiae bacterium]|nr:PSD1 domain-containing protein [Verrucomicrobiae bacterium]
MFVISRTALATTALTWLTLALSDATPVDFNRDVRPILSDKCFFCHGPDAHKRKADLRLDTAEGATAIHDGRAAVVPGKPEASTLLVRITSTDEDEKMPPPESHKQLGDDEIALLREWITQGAVYAAPWAYVAPKWNPVPVVNDQSWPVNWVDQFVLAKLESEGLAPSPDADRVTLIRRLYFDLTGLPPAPEQVDAFVAAEEPFGATWSKMVDELLQSPRFGERLAMYWLDLVRYADTVGYHGDQDHNIAPYRDWVVDALNQDLPFDQFTREQLAGDLLPNPTIQQRIATGYNRLLQTSHEGGVQEKEYLAIYAADRIRNVSNVWMGATVGCAQCHDHKFDPYTIKDFYSMVGFFADIDESQHFKVGTNDLPTRRPPEIEVINEADEELLVDLEERLAKSVTASEPTDVLEAQIALIKKRARRTMVTVALKQPRTVRVLPRGNWLDDSGEIVDPAIPDFLGSLDTGDRRATRLDLANWLVDPEKGNGGSTARVFANRFWYLFFGSGISRSLADFGGQGEPPANPALLDNLAVSFYQNGWSMKALVRLLVTSHSYRQSSLESVALRERDPNNQLVARQSRYRLPAEIVRDNALAISGLLVTGPSERGIKPYQPAGYYRHLNFPARSYRSDEDAGQYRRGLYVHWQRQFLHPMLKAMDAPSREECTAQRPRSNTPTAALVLLNDPTFVEAARVFAARIIEQGGTTTTARLDFACRQAIGREPDDRERQILDELLNDSRYTAEAAAQLLETGIAPQPDGIDPVELASWTTIARAILNLSETVTRN